MALSTFGGLYEWVSGLLWGFSGKKAGLRIPAQEAVPKEAQRSREQEAAAVQGLGENCSEKPTLAYDLLWPGVASRWFPGPLNPAKKDLLVG